MTEPNEKETTKPKAPTTGKTVKVPKVPKSAKATKAAKPAKAPKEPKAEDPSEGYRPIRNRLRSSPTSGPKRRLRIRFPTALLPRIKEGGDLGVPLAEFVKTAFQARTAKSEVATPPRPLKGRTITVPAEIATDVLAFEKDGGDLDRLVYAALVRKLKL